MAKFLLRFGDVVMKEIPIEGNASVFTAGTKPDNDVVLENPSVSGHHIKFTREGKQYFAEDLNSANGTFVNGKRITKSGICDKDIIHLASLDAMSHSFEFFSEEAIGAMALPASAARVADTASPAAASVMSEQSLPVDVPAPAEKIPDAAPVKPGRPEPPAPLSGKTGSVKILSGADVIDSEIELKNAVTYIGKGQQCGIKIKGMFAPEVAAAINRRPDMYKIIPVKDGYAKVNDVPLASERDLVDGDRIEAGKTAMLFYFKDAGV